MPVKPLKQPQRRFPTWVIVLAAITALVVATTAWYILKPIDGPVPANAGERFAALEQGYTAEGFPRLGSADAPILIEDFSSYACPHCREFDEDRFPTLVSAIAAGEVQFVLIPVPHIGPGAEDAARAMMCAGEQNSLWAMHDVLYYWQKEFLTRTFDSRRLEKGATNLGLDTAAFKSCLRADRTGAVIDAARQAFSQRGLTGTPSFFINGEKVRDYREFDNLDISINTQD